MSQELATRRVRQTPLLVTEAGFGGASAGNLYRETSDAEAATAVQAAWAGGNRYFDTAPHYGLSLSEARLGEALRSRPRIAAIIAAVWPPRAGPRPRPATS